MKMQPVVDVKDLDDSALDHRSPLWWGNVLLLAIETTMFALLFGAYLYIRNNYPEWPPPRVAGPAADFAPYPDLLLPTISLIVLLGGMIPMYVADRAAWRMDQRAVRNAGAVAVLLGLTAIVIRVFEFSALHFRWDDNAYASVAWSLVGMHFIHQLVITSEDTFMLAWVQFRSLEPSHARDVRITAIYWHWVALMYIPVYVIVYLGPRFL